MCEGVSQYLQQCQGTKVVPLLQVLLQLGTTCFAFPTFVPAARRRPSSHGGFHAGEDLPGNAVRIGHGRQHLRAQVCATGNGALTMLTGVLEESRYAKLCLSLTRGNMVQPIGGNDVSGGGPAASARAHVTPPPAARQRPCCRLGFHAQPVLRVFLGRAAAARAPLERSLAAVARDPARDGSHLDTCGTAGRWPGHQPRAWSRARYTSSTTDDILRATKTRRRVLDIHGAFIFFSERRGAPVHAARPQLLGAGVL